MFQRLFKHAIKMIYVQAAIVLLLTILAFFLWGKFGAFSVFIGGLVWMLATFYFIHKIFGKGMIKFGPGMVRRFLIAAGVKFLFFVVLIIVMIKFLPILVIPFLCGLIGAILGSVLFPVILKLN